MKKTSLLVFIICTLLALTSCQSTKRKQSSSAITNNALNKQLEKNNKQLEENNKRLEEKVKHLEQQINASKEDTKFIKNATNFLKDQRIKIGDSIRRMNFVLNYISESDLAWTNNNPFHISEESNELRKYSKTFTEPVLLIDDELCIQNKNTELKLFRMLGNNAEKYRLVLLTRNSKRGYEIVDMTKVYSQYCLNNLLDDKSKEQSCKANSNSETETNNSQLITAKLTLLNSVHGGKAFIKPLKLNTDYCLGIYAPNGISLFHSKFNKRSRNSHYYYSTSDGINDSIQSYSDNPNQTVVIPSRQLTTKSDTIFNWKLGYK